MQNKETDDRDDFQNTGDVDLVAEADVYMAYGRHELAEEILLKEIKSNPNRFAALFKLGALYSESRDADKFKAIISQIKKLSNETDENYYRALELELLFDQYSKSDDSSIDSSTSEDLDGILADQGPTYTEQVATNDLLGREKITFALAKLLTERVNTHPISIGLFGPWGSGKSSQISFLQKEIKEAKRIRISVFNAWEYEHSENMGAALAQTIVEDLLRDMGLWRQIAVATKLAALENHRFVNSAMRDTNKFVGTIFQWSSILPSLLIPATVCGILALFVFQWISTSALIQTATTVLGAGTAAWIGLQKFLNEYLANWIDKNRSQSQISKRLGLPDFRNKIGVHYEIRTALSHVCNFCIKHSLRPEEGEYLLIVIDDLDRCSPSVVKDTLDAVRLVANIDRIITLVAIDPRIAYSAAIKHFEQFPQSGRSPEVIARDYLGKVFQVAITLPSAPAAATTKFIYEELFHGHFQPVRTGTKKSKISEKPLEGDEEILLRTIEAQSVIRNYKKSSPAEVEIFSALTHACQFSNPRQLWRLKQAWQLMKGISFHDGLDISSLKPWMRALFLCEYLLQTDHENASVINKWLQKQSQAAPDIIIRLALGDPVDSAFSDYLSRAEVVAHVLLPAASK